MSLLGLKRTSLRIANSSFPALIWTGDWTFVQRRNLPGGGNKSLGRLVAGHLLVLKWTRPHVPY
jgi:hypothetical protein